MKVAQGYSNTKVGKAGLIINKFKGENHSVQEVLHQTGLEILGYILEDNNVKYYDSTGRPLLELPADSPSLMAISEILKQIA